MEDKYKAVTLEEKTKDRIQSPIEESKLADGTDVSQSRAGKNTMFVALLNLLLLNCVVNIELFSPDISCRLSLGETRAERLMSRQSRNKFEELPTICPNFRRWRTGD